MMLQVIRTVLLSAVVVSHCLLHPTSVNAEEDHDHGSEGALEFTGFTVEPETTAVVIIDPQKDFLTEGYAAWGLVGENVLENDTVNNIAKLMAAAKETGMLLFISPHWYFPTDHHWEFEGTLEKAMHGIHMFDRAGQLNLTGFDGSGSDWVDELKEYIEDEDTIIASPHKIYGPQTNDLALQLRKRKIDKVILGGMSANLCVESHMRDLIEQGFEIVVVKDATAAAQTTTTDGEYLDGYKAALVNYKMIASDVWSADETVAAMLSAAGVSDETPAANATVTEKGGVRRKF